MTLLAPTLESFFTTRLSGQLGASANTIAAYRDTWRLLLRYVADNTGTAAHASAFMGAGCSRLGRRPPARKGEQLFDGSPFHPRPPLGLSRRRIDPAPFATPTR